jgi:hypothetical protein
LVVGIVGVAFERVASKLVASLVVVVVVVSFGLVASCLVVVAWGLDHLDLFVAFDPVGCCCTVVWVLSCLVLLVCCFGLVSYFIVDF